MGKPNLKRQPHKGVRIMSVRFLVLALTSFAALAVLLGAGAALPARMPTAAEPPASPPVLTDQVTPLELRSDPSGATGTPGTSGSAGIGTSGSKTGTVGKPGQTVTLDWPRAR
ncbi:hypothetical protein [Saccharopolyspora pogona]|uniref:hypothetical protein n=1 Tax=Saccharopolyspora pogona TaxID=333966 RepID=UPI001683ECBF|nr:hypothetical protein [Saccharopolyspora pogona]